MNTKQKQSIESALRVQAFLLRNPVPPPFDLSAAKAELDSAIDELAGHALAQATNLRAGRAETFRLKRQITVLRMHHLRPIVAIARASMRTKPGIQAALKTPSSKLSVTRLLAEARGIRNVAREYEPVFLEKGRPQDFLAQLDAAIDAVGESVTARSQHLGAKAGANAGLTQAIQRGRKAVAMLDSVIRVAFEDQEAVLRAWDIAQRVQALPGGSGTLDEEDAPVQTAA